MKKLNKGFTLIELIIVIAILGIIALIAIPNLAGIRQRSQIAADKRTAEQIGKAIRIWYTDTDANKTRVLPSILNTETSKDNIIVRLDKISTSEGKIFEGFTNYMSIPGAPKSWGATGNDISSVGAYYISTTGAVDDNGVSQKIAVGISSNNADISDLTGTSKMSLFNSLFTTDVKDKVITREMVSKYDGSKAGWCFLEQ